MNIFPYITNLLNKVRYLFPAFILFGLVIQNSSAISSTGSHSQPKEITKQTHEQRLKDQWGIELTSVRMTAAGHMVDFRYRVLDTTKAAPLHKRQTKPYLIHQASGKVLAVPNTAKVGSLRNSNIPKEGRIYWMFFGNKGVVKNGDKVSVVIGDFRIDDIEVE